MSVIDIKRPALPNFPPPPADSDYWKFYGDFDEDGHIDTTVRGVELYPADDLVGRRSLEDRVSGAEIRHEQGIALSHEEIALVALAHECVDLDYEDRAL